jgi:hypothetical protein
MREDLPNTEREPAITTYSCSCCGVAVLVLPNHEMIKGCMCGDVPVIAHCSAVVKTNTANAG